MSCQGQRVKHHNLHVEKKPDPRGEVMKLHSYEDSLPKKQEN